VAAHALGAVLCESCNCEFSPDSRDSIEEFVDDKCMLTIY
jgi:hypothetical protein